MHVVDAWQVLKGEANVGHSVVVADWRCDWIGLGLAEKLPGSRIVDGRFMGVQQSIAVPKGKDAGLHYLRDVVEEAKKSGLVARAIDKTGAKGVSVAPPAK